jgi:hypothetical protein
VEHKFFPNRLVLAVGASGPGPARLVEPTTDVTNKFTGSLNNYGIPGARVFHLYGSGYGSVLELAGTQTLIMLVSTSESSTVIDDAAAADGTFFTLWIGNNDILGYASSGGSGVDNNETGAGQHYGTIALQITIRLRECIKLHL